LLPTPFFFGANARRDRATTIAGSTKPSCTKTLTCLLPLSAARKIAFSDLHHCRRRLAHTEADATPTKNGGGTEAKIGINEKAKEKQITSN